MGKDAERLIDSALTKQQIADRIYALSFSNLFITIPQCPQRFCVRRHKERLFDEFRHVELAGGKQTCDTILYHCRNCPRTMVPINALIHLITDVKYRLDS